MAENKVQPTENKVVPNIPIGRLPSKTSGTFTVMPIDSAEYKKEADARKNRNRESELKVLDAETRTNIEAANAQGKGVMWQKPNGSSYLFTGQKPDEKALDKKKKDEEKGVWAWCKRNWGWLLAGAVAIGVGAYFLIRNNKKKDKNQVAAKTLKKEIQTQLTGNTNQNSNTSGENTNTSGGNTNTSGGNTNASGGNTNASGGNTNTSGGNTNASGGNTNSSGENTNSSTEGGSLSTTGTLSDVADGKLNLNNGDKVLSLSTTLDTLKNNSAGHVVIPEDTTIGIDFNNMGQNRINF